LLITGTGCVKIMGYELSFIGLLISAIFLALTGIYPGGIIVPSYLVLFVDQPLRIAGTLAAALLTMVCYRLASQFIILFGRRRFVFMIVAGGIWTLLWYSVLPFIFPDSLEFRIIGWMIPGLIANHFERQGIGITVFSLVTVTMVIYFIGQIVYRIY